MGLNIILVVVPKSNYGFLGLLRVSLNKNFGRHKNILMTNCQFFADPRQSDVSQPGEYPPCSFAVGWFINHKVGSDEMTEIQTENSFYNLVPLKYQLPEDLKRMYRSLNFFVPFLQIRWLYDNNVKKTLVVQWPASKLIMNAASQKSPQSTKAHCHRGNHGTSLAHFLFAIRSPPTWPTWGWWCWCCCWSPSTWSPPTVGS